MKVLFPCGLFYPSRLGGPANTIYWLAKALQTNSIDVSVVTTDNCINKGAVCPDSWNEVGGVRVRYCHSKGKFPIKVVVHANKQLRTSDVVVFCSICYLPNFPIFLKALLQQKKVIWSPRGELLDSALQGNKAKLTYFKLLKLISRGRILFHATSEEEKQSIQKVFGQTAKVVMIPNYMELPTKCVRNDNAEKYLLYVGRIAPIKALDQLLTGLSLSKLWRKSGYSFKFVGPVEEQFKEYYQKLMTLVKQYDLKDSVQFVGPLYEERKFQTYADARCLFLVSNSENFGNVVIESLSQGTPVVASQGTPWQQLESCNAGHWISNAPEEIAKCVDELLSMNEEQYLRQRANALNLVKKFDVYENIEDWVKLFNQ